jgi:hypothetical protein
MAPLLGRATILILSAILLWFAFTYAAGSAAAKLAVFGAAVGVVSYMGLVFTTPTKRSKTGS